ncbi:hypothetical protein MLP_02920 [Microlunatus phosphovorus NM-1]|uniref:Uncharacterized protein n=1 Tax=Microlunatus phosphovorus (strain ATCC 700054 / DSM 10555 / JCM 9379 / NBRC 101784 / NCIMB 13414 / VKM Ac-1990 / NM-1) TaxID=1032480 RepID=F5XIY0_MICPN|nr:hypothetical protein MLP_02920 [Microlunatus phosphovorus NM-1]
MSTAAFVFLVASGTVTIDPDNFTTPPSPAPSASATQSTPSDDQTPTDSQTPDNEPTGSATGR